MNQMKFFLFSLGICCLSCVTEDKTVSAPVINYLKILHSETQAECESNNGIWGEHGYYEYDPENECLAYDGLPVLKSSGTVFVCTQIEGINRNGIDDDVSVFYSWEFEPNKIIVLKKSWPAYTSLSYPELNWFYCSIYPPWDERSVCYAGTCR